MILLIDNYDSFSYNLYQLDRRDRSGYPGHPQRRNDGRGDQEPCSPTASSSLPARAGLRMPASSIEAGKSAGTGHIPILGVCLGHQAICAAFGATVTYAEELMHGKQSNVTLRSRTVRCSAGCPETAPVARYHSLAADADTLPGLPEGHGAVTADGEVMAVQHTEYPDLRRAVPSRIDPDAEWKARCCKIS